MSKPLVNLPHIEPPFEHEERSTPRANEMVLMLNLDNMLRYYRKLHIVTEAVLRQVMPTMTDPEDQALIQQLLEKHYEKRP